MEKISFQSTTALSQWGMTTKKVTMFSSAIAEAVTYDVCVCVCVSFSSFLPTI